MEAPFDGLLVKLVKMHLLIDLKLFINNSGLFMTPFITPLFAGITSTDKITKAFIANTNLVSLLITGYKKK